MTTPDLTTATAGLAVMIAGLPVTAVTPVLARRPLPAGTDRAAVPLFGADKWSLAAALPDRHTADQTLNWTRYPAPLREACKLYAFALVNIVTDAPRLANARSDIPAIKTLIADLGYLHPFVTWLHHQGITALSDVSPTDLDSYHQHVTDTPGTSSQWKRKAFVAVQRLHIYRDHLPARARLPAGPLWGGASAADLAQQPPVRNTENRTPRIHPDVMEVLLSAALLVLDTIAADLLPVARRVIALRTLAHRLVGETGPRPPIQGAARNRYLDQHLERLLEALTSAHQPLPGRCGHATDPAAQTSSIHGAGEDEVVLDHAGLATAGWLERGYLHSHAARHIVATSGLPLQVDLLQVTRFTPINSRPWREHPVDIDVLGDLLRHITTAGFLAIAYLSGIRTGEALNLTRGCITREDALGLIFLSGLQMKASGTRRERSPRTVPWVVTDHTARAVAVLEAIAPGRMLFPGGKLFTAEWMDNADTASRRTGMISHDIKAFIIWFNTDIASQIQHPVIGEDPHGTIIASRLRRTLAWHIVRRPGGTIAGATQYGHVHTQLIQGYAGRANAGFLDEITFEQFLLTAENFLDDRTRLQHGEHVSGPAAEAYRHRLTTDGHRFAGLTITTPAYAGQALANPALHIHHGDLVTCVYRPETAACRDQDDTTSGPAWTRCRLTCSNIARTDRDITRLHDHIRQLTADLAAPGLPEPLRRRIQQRLDAHHHALTDHHTTTPANTLDSADQHDIDPTGPRT